MKKTTRIMEEKQLSDKSIEYIHKISIVGAIGGTIFDYFKDKGVKKVNLYGNDELVEILYKQAFWAGIEIEHIYGTSNKTFEIDFMEKHKEKSKNIQLLHSKTVIDSNVPVVLCETPPISMKNQYGLTDLIKYSFNKNVLLDKVLNYKNSYAPQLEIVLLFLPSLVMVKNRNDYENDLLKNKRRMKRSEVYASLGKDKTYIKETFRFMSGNICEKNGIHFFADRNGKYFNSQGGYRSTTDIPENPVKTIYTFGTSLCFGMGVDDEFTIQSVLQRKINEYNHTYAVINCGNGGSPNLQKQWKSFEYHKPQNGDIVVLMNYYTNLIAENYSKLFNCCRPQGVSKMFDRPHDLGKYVFIDKLHYTYIGYREIGNYLADFMIEKRIINENSETARRSDDSMKMPSPGSALENAIENPLLQDYLDSIKKYADYTGKTGAIVMNCNPFTLGHRYLIEYAASKCDKLFIFAVQEDKSFFSFEDRITLIKNGTADLLNVVIVPSGNFIISRETFPAYFDKDSLQENVVIDASHDIEIFASKIAPMLNISIRFVGEEPLCNLTRQYNMQMRLILPRYGIELEIIPRKESGSQAISASRVRRLLEQKNFDEIAEIVPVTTLQYLKEKFGG